jgi:hypothetical protein
MRCKRILPIGMLLLMAIGLLSGCAKESPPEGATSVSELLAVPLYDTQITIYGKVSLLGELRCPCFELTSGGESVLVWYEHELPAISIEGIQNGDQVIVTGELKTAGVDRLNEFAANKIESGE